VPKKRKNEEQIEILPFEDNYIICAADLSLRCPGFCLLEMDKGNIKNVELFSLNNKGKKKTHGQILNEIYDLFFNNVIHELNIFPPLYYVREKMVMNLKVPSERDVAKVVGLMDFILGAGNKEWHEIYPVTVKKIITGSGKAEKSEVAAGLEKYIGKQNYKCDDESDAAAVAVAWLIQQGQIKELPNV